MTTETTPNAPTQTSDNAAPIVTDNQVTVTSPVVEPVVATDPTAPVAPNVDPSAAQSEANKDWALKRINEITAKRYAAEREADATKQELQAEKNARMAAEAKAAELLTQISKANPGAADPVAPKVTEDEIERRAQEKAAMIARANEFNKACNAIVETGKKEFAGSWDDTVKNLSLVGAIGQNVPADFLETAIELKNPAQILHYLGQNLEEAERIVKSPPKKMAMEMARIEAMLNAPKVAPPAPPVSNAPAPVIPVGGAAKPGEKSIDDPTLTSEEFYALRSKQLEEKRNRYRRA